MAIGTISVSVKAVYFSSQIKLIGYNTISISINRL